VKDTTWNNCSTCLHSSNQSTMVLRFFTRLSPTLTSPALSEKTGYGECTEDLPPNMTEARRGVGMTMRAFVDSDHAGDTTTRRSRSGFIIFLNNAPIYYWFSKKQTSVETSSFGAEFVAITNHLLPKQPGRPSPPTFNHNPHPHPSGGGTPSRPSVIMPAL